MYKETLHMFILLNNYMVDNPSRFYIRINPHNHTNSRITKPGFPYHRENIYETIPLIQIYKTKKQS